MFKQKRIRLFFERNGFAVSTRLAEVLGMKVKSVRLFFIISFEKRLEFDTLNSLRDSCLFHHYFSVPSIGLLVAFG